LYIDGSFIKQKIPVKPIYITVRNLNSVVSGKACAWRVLGMMPSLRKSATLAQTDTWRKDRRLRLHHACIDHVVQTVVYDDIRVYNRSNSSTPQSITPRPAPGCAACRMLLIPVLRSLMSSLPVWNGIRQSRIAEDELPGLQDKAVELLDLLQRNLPDKTGEKGKWNFEKAHSILHKVREIILWGNSDNTTCQGPEVCIYQVYTYLF
jgi:hypothetical protein